jgi:hypothetical protein
VTAAALCHATLKVLLAAAPADFRQLLVQRALVSISHEEPESKQCTAVRTLIESLLKQGAQVDTASGCETALCNLVQKGCASCVQHLITAHSADVSTHYGEDHRTVLHECVQSGADTSAAVLGVVLAADATGALLAQQDSSGCTALHTAVGTTAHRWFNAKPLAAMLSCSSESAVCAALAKQDQQGRTVLHYALSKSSSSEHLKELLAVCKRLGVLPELLRKRDLSDTSALCAAQRCAAPTVLAAVRQFDAEVTCQSVVHNYLMPSITMLFNVVVPNSTLSTTHRQA